MKTTLTASQVEELKLRLRECNEAVKTHNASGNQLMANYEAGKARVILDLFGMLREPELWEIKITRFVDCEAISSDVYHFTTREAGVAFMDSKIDAAMKSGKGFYVSPDRTELTRRLSDNKERCYELTRGEFIK